MRRAELASDAAYDRDDYERDEVTLPLTLILTRTLALTLTHTLTLTLTRTRCTCDRAEAARSCSRASAGSSAVAAAAVAAAAAAAASAALRVRHRSGRARPVANPPTPSDEAVAHGGCAPVQAICERLAFARNVQSCPVTCSALVPLHRC